MKLSALPLLDVNSVNSYETRGPVTWTQGDALYVYFRLLDSNLDRPEQGFSPSGRRYCPAASSTLSVQINSIDSTKTYTKTASQPYSVLDASIWRIQISATDLIVGSPDLLLTLTEGAVVTRGRVRGLISVHSQTESF